MSREFQLASDGRASLPLHLVEEISHRVVNEYAEAICGLSLAATGPVGGELRQALRRAAERLQAHAESHRALLPPRNAQVNLADYIGTVCAAFSRATLAQRRVGLVLEADEIWIASDRAWRLGLAAVELIRNAARHGLQGRGGVIWVQVMRSCGDVICLVNDDGAVPARRAPGRGTALVQALAGELGGTVEWRTGEPGCLACLRIPAEAGA
ncbi:sensor histidine kinase [Caulobacter sp. 602-1]|uniref:histidine kinase dimerization/phosphoacceptor domain -containing protein n=1 Tax=Caulobacter sp. 602-1 TaxID=2492472 RepID=UPI001315480A|nr:sensor histidine kinase [Caulobacter sp. 602-1]